MGREVRVFFSLGHNRCGPGAKNPLHRLRAWPKGTIRVCDHLLKDPPRPSSSQRGVRPPEIELLSRLPAFEASNPMLSEYYTRSLQHLILNRWTVPEFVLNPYYSTGSIKGGCVGCYLWDYGILPELMPLYDPAASREHIKQFLKVDITKHFLFNPVDEGDGPRIVNQEKIIGCIYYYVLHTGVCRSWKNR